MSSQTHETSATTPAPAIAVVLAGGASSRLGGTDKTRIPIAGVTALERVLRTAPVDRRIVVGHDGADGAALSEHYGAHFVLENPPRSGPLAALARGVAEIPQVTATSTGEGLDSVSGSQVGSEHGTLSGTTVLVLGADMPLLRTETLAGLLERSAREQKIVALAGAEGQVQFLCAAWPLERLRAALDAAEREDGGWADLSLRRLYDQLAPGELVTRPESGAEGSDIDTPDALERARSAAGPRIALAQLEADEDFAATERTVRAAVATAAQAGAQLVLLPEATLTPFGTDLRAVADAHHDAFDRLVGELAEEHRIVVVAGSFTPADGDRVHNTVIVRGPAGVVPSLDYRKIHLFDAFGAMESETVAPGSELVTFELGGARFGIATCYDVRFAEQFTALARRGAEAVLLPLAWADGAGKSDQLRLLLRARALDSTCVLLAADQAPPADYTGKAARGIGQSAVVGPLGQIQQELGRAPGMLLADLDLAEVRSARAALPVLEHAVPLPTD